MATQLIESSRRGRTIGKDKKAAALTDSDFCAMLVVAEYTGTKMAPLHLMQQLEADAHAVLRGDMAQVESMLINQAVALQSMFADLAVRAKSSTVMDNVHRLTQLALKAQANSRATLQTLADVKQPRQVAFVKQANIAETQQVNNGAAASPSAKKTNIQPIELFVEQADGSTTMDARAASQASGTDQNLVTVEHSQRPRHIHRKSNLVA